MQTQLVFQLSEVLNLFAATLKCFVLLLFSLLAENGISKAAAGKRASMHKLWCLKFKYYSCNSSSSSGREREGERWLKKFPDLTNKIESIMGWRCWASVEVETKVPQLMFQKCGRFMNPTSVGWLQRFTQGIIKTLSTINDKSLQGVNAWHLAEPDSSTLPSFQQKYAETSTATSACFGWNVRSSKVSNKKCLHTPRWLN